MSVWLSESSWPLMPPRHRHMMPEAMFTGRQKDEQIKWMDERQTDGWTDRHTGTENRTECPQPTQCARRDAVKIFLEHAISGAPVVDEEGHLVGVLSESDILWKVRDTPSKMKL
jgi:ABC-type proline/glycine betaine transport system ATPase subunit